MTTQRKGEPGKGEPASHKPKSKQPAAGKPVIQGSWPDGETRQQMSQSQSHRENLGKHGKNEDWAKKW